MAIKIKVSNPNFNGFRAGIRFYNGVGTFEDLVLGKRIAEELGYKIEEITGGNVDGKETPKKTPSKKSTSKMGALKND
ncbi:MAG: hypothetical protein K0S71_333 [Clostridia bacterium]|jgi:hypothetical protein|nr:hypothetical protein [Clostridia bacterium]